MNQTWFEQLCNQAMVMRPYPDPRFPPSPYYRFLRLLATNMQPSLSVELGVCGGGGSLHLALGWPGGKVVGVDVAWDHADNVRYVEEHCPNFHFWRGDSVEAAPEIYAKFGKANILFVDTTHTYEQTHLELRAWQPFLADRAVVCFDDLYRKEMLNFWDELPEPKVRLDILHTGGDAGGFGVVWKQP